MMFYVYQNCNDPRFDFSTYEVTNTKLHLVKVVTISPFDWCSATIINAWLNKDDTRICFSYNDSILFIHDFKLSITCSVKTAFVSSFIFIFLILLLKQFLKKCDIQITTT